MTPLALPHGCRELVERALEEDIGPGDLSGLWFVPEDSRNRAALVSRAKGCLAGVHVAAEVFRCVDPGIAIRCKAGDGTLVEPGFVVLELEGSTRSLLSAERTALNFIQQLSGVATLTRSFVEAIEGTGARILDTRKTLPGWRSLQKAAVLAGGGTNHRMGLYDMVMLKDNHLAALGGNIASLDSAIAAFHTANPDIRVEVEADTVDQVRELLVVEGIAVILLDNMTLQEMKECVALRALHAPDILLEASGGITLETARDIASTGVDFLSVGALTHSVPALDLALDFL
jgi:nicotinate-nucleotide pyrophosphorylase (carboxylating)